MRRHVMAGAIRLGAGASGAIRLGAAILAAILPVTGTTAASAAVSADIQHLPFRRSVSLLAEGRPARAIIEEDSLLAAGAAPDFADIRLMNDAGEALALVREPLRRMDEVFTDWRSIPLRWSSGWPGRSGDPNDTRWMVIDLGDDAPPELILAFQGPVANQAVTVEGSRDSTEWSTLTQRYDVNMPPPKDHRFNLQRVALAETRRWLRIRQDSPFQAPSVDDRLDLMQRYERSTPRVSVGYTADTGYQRTTGQGWEAILKLTGPPRAVTRIDLSASDAVRSQLGFEVMARLPKGGWQYVGIEKAPDWSGGSRDSLVFLPIRTSEIKLVVTGGDAPNPPVELHALWATPERWIFEIGSGTGWWLAWGDPFLTTTDGVRGETPAMRPPVAIASTSTTPPARTHLGPPEPNPFHREPGFGLEWLRRRPVVLSVAMVVILVLVALVARRPRPAAGSGA